MFSEKDYQQIEQRGSNTDVVKQQITNFEKGFPFLNIERAATINNGIIKLNYFKLKENADYYDKEIRLGVKPVKFIPASGAASRMFKSLHSALNDFEKGEKQEDVYTKNADLKEFMEHLEQFAFFDDLQKTLKSHGADKKPIHVLTYLLTEKGLNYGSLPKGLLKFHKYDNSENRTPFEEHLIEASDYSSDKRDIARLHFTVSPEHKDSFEKLYINVRRSYEKETNVKYSIDFSVQKPSTDTIAVTLDNQPFRNEDGSLLFRPGGHGALIENLNDIDADIIFIKNIDNVVPDKLKLLTKDYKKALGGILLSYQKKLFEYQKVLNENSAEGLSSSFYSEVLDFIGKTMNIEHPIPHYYTVKSKLHHYLLEKLNRPFRVCGMVKNEGEPGGGPFWTKNPDESVSLQIVESSQIDPNNEQQQEIVKNATHFNPVDIVCGVKNYKGEKYDLTKFVNPETGFITKKSSDGKELKAQELPGLWNGAMSNWNTLFVEVPIETFTPVKKVNDLLREEHQ